MKRNFIKQAQLMLLFVAVGIGLVACNKDVLYKVDQNGVSTDVWNTESAATLYLNATYDLVMPNWPAAGAIHNTSDESASANASILNGTLTGVGAEIGDIGTKSGLTTDSYWWIYRCNQAIEGINNGTMSDVSKRKLKGQFFFLRGYIYFTLIRIYGGVPLILKTQDPSKGPDSLYVPRSPSSVCVKAIVADMDSAANLLPSTWSLGTDGGRINRATAMAFKGKTLLYWASPQFNPQDNHPERWTDAYNACKAAYTQAIADGFGLYPLVSGGLGNLFIDETTNNKERMMWRTLDATSVSPTHGTALENNVRPVSETTGGGGSYQPTWNLVTAFPSDNGLPITDPVNTTPNGAGVSNYDAVQYWRRRDPRFYQTIAYNGQIWNLSGKTNRKEWTYTGFLDDVTKPSTTGFYCRKISNPNITPAQAPQSTNTGGGSGMDWIELRFAEVLLNYADAANGAGFYSEAKNLVVTLRQARGFAAGSYNYGLSVVPDDKAKIADFLLTEREVEFAMEGKRYWDLRRTRQYDKLLNGKQRLAIKISVNSPYVAGAIPAGGKAAGKIYIDVADPGTVRTCDTINVDYKSSYTKFFTAQTATIEPATAPVINYPTNYYFYPIPTTFIATSPLIQQTLGWPGGTFDPLL